MLQTVGFADEDIDADAKDGEKTAIKAMKLKAEKTVALGIGNSLESPWRYLRLLTHIAPKTVPFGGLKTLADL